MEISNQDANAILEAFLALSAQNENLTEQLATEKTKRQKLEKSLLPAQNAESQEQLEMMCRALMNFKG